MGSGGIPDHAGGASAGGLGGDSGDWGGAGGIAAGTEGRCISTDDSDDPYPNLSFAGLLTAVELAPLRVVVADDMYPANVSIASGGVDALCNGSAEIASNAETQLLRASANCNSLRVLFTIGEGLYRVVARKSSGIAGVADLAGKRVMAPQATSSHYFLIQLLGAYGLSLGNGAGQVRFVNGFPGSGTFTGFNPPDAATIWDAEMELAARPLGDDALVLQNDPDGKPVYREIFNLHSTEEVLANPVKRRGIVHLVRQLIIASAQIEADPSRAIEVLRGPTGASASVLETAMTYERYAGILVPDLLDVMEKEEVWRAAVDSRPSRNRAQLEMLIDPSVYEDATSCDD